VPAGSPGIGGFPQGHREDLRADDLLGAATTERPLRAPTVDGDGHTHVSDRSPPQSAAVALGCRRRRDHLAEDRRLLLTRSVGPLSDAAESVVNLVAPLDLSAYRIVQEGLTHAHAPT
jgi:hypothetical protein